MFGNVEFGKFNDGIYAETHLEQGLHLGTAIHGSDFLQGLKHVLQITKEET